MDHAWELLADNTSPAGRAVSSVAVLLVGALIAWIGGRAFAARVHDGYSRYYARKVIRYVVALIAALVLAMIWRAFAGRAGVVLGLAAAGLAFAMQEGVGAIAGWFNIVSGRIYRVGDRVQLGGVRGDVVDITPLRTKVLEIGSTGDEASWVRGRQYTGRLVAVSNKMTFTEPVFNFSAAFDYLWEELTFPIPYGADWHRAEAIVLEEVRRASSTEGAQEAMAAMARDFPIPRADVEPRVYVRATDNWYELAARFVVPVRTARLVKDDVTRRVLEQFDAAGLRIASTTADVTVHEAAPGPG